MKVAVVETGIAGTILLEPGERIKRVPFHAHPAGRVAEAPL